MVMVALRQSKEKLAEGGVELVKEGFTHTAKVLVFENWILLFLCSFIVGFQIATSLLFISLTCLIFVYFFFSFLFYFGFKILYCFVGGFWQCGIWSRTHSNLDFFPFYTALGMFFFCLCSVWEINYDKKYECIRNKYSPKPSYLPQYSPPQSDLTHFILLLS